jgi:predicted nucleic acid-binding protein
LIVVDTSVLIGLFRGWSTPAIEQLRRLEMEGSSFAIPGVCCQEILQGAKDEREWNLLKEVLEAQEILFPLDPWEAHRSAARIYFDCRRKGLTIRSSADCLIAQVIIENEAILLHDDEDFERIRKVRPLKTWTPA